MSFQWHFNQKKSLQTSESPPPRAVDWNIGSNAVEEDVSLISLRGWRMGATAAEEEWGRIDGEQGGTGKVIKNASCRCFWSTSKWCACQRRRQGLMHYWAGTRLAPGADIPFAVHLAARGHVGDSPGHTSPRGPSPHRGPSHAWHYPQR